MKNDQEIKNIEVQEEKESKAEVKNPNIKTITLKEPLEIDGASLNEINMDFGKMKGADVLKIDAELKAEGYSEGFHSIGDQQVCVRIASRASGVLVDDLARLGMFEFAEMTFTVRNFFFGY